MRGLSSKRYLDLKRTFNSFDDRGIALVPFGLERSLEIRHEPGPEVSVRLGAGDDLVEPGLGQRQLLRGAHPGLRRRGQSPDQACKALFVESGHRELDGLSASVLPSRSSRSLPRHLEMRLAIVPGRELERLADGAIALVAGEEAVEDLPAVLRRGGQGLVDGERVLEHRQRLLRPGELELLVRGRAARARRRAGGRCTAAA